MPSGSRRGRVGGGVGFGFRGSSPPWPYVGRGRGGLPRCFYPGSFMAPPYWPASMPFAPRMTQEQELDFLKSQAEVMKAQLEQIEARMRELRAQEKS